MKTVKKMFMIVYVLGLLNYLALNIDGCSEYSPLSSIILQEKVGGSATPIDDQTYEQSDIGQISILQMESSALTSFQANSVDTLLSKEKYITAEFGGVVKVGLDSLGFCMLKFSPGDLRQNTTIKVEWKLTDGKFLLDFEPEGLQFNHPIEFIMLYKTANLTGINEDKINLFYYNIDLQFWQLQFGKADKKNKMFQGTIDHFSRYSLAHSE